MLVCGCGNLHRREARMNTQAKEIANRLSLVGFAMALGGVAGAIVLLFAICLAPLSYLAYGAWLWFIIPGLMIFFGLLLMYLVFRALQREG